MSTTWFTLYTRIYFTAKSNTAVDKKTAVFLFVFNSVLIVRTFSFTFEKLADFIVNRNC